MRKEQAMTRAGIAGELRSWALRLVIATAIIAPVCAPTHGWADAASSKEYYEDALDWLNKGDYRAAVIQLRNALQQDSDNYAARLLLGRLYLQSGNLAAAEKELDAAHRGAPSDETEIYLGKAQLGLRQYQEVLDTVRPEAADPSVAATKNLIRGEALFALNRLDEAAKAVEPLRYSKSASVPANLLMARIEARQGDLDASDRYIDAALAANPDLMEAHILRAQLALQARKLDRVLEIADEIEKAAPDDPRGPLIRAEALVRKNDLPAAKGVLEKILADQPETPAALYLYARVLMLLGDYTMADQSLAKLPDQIRDQPATSLIVGLVKYQLQQFGEAEQALERFVSSVSGNESRQARRLLATIQLRTDRPLAAMRSLAPIIADDSSDIASLRLNASAALRAGDLDRAKDSLERISQIGTANDQRQAAAFLQILNSGTRNENGKLTLSSVPLGVLEALDLAQMGEGDAALARARQLATEVPNNTAVANLLARLYVAQGDLKAARAALEPVLERDPADVATVTNMNRIDISEGKFDAVEARLRTALAKQPENELYALQLAQFLENQGRRADAITMLEGKAAELPESLAIRTTLITLNLRQSQTEAARKWADQALEIGKTTNPNGLAVAGEAYYTMRDYTAAADAYLLQTENQPDSSEAKLRLARARFAGGDADGAKAALEAVLKDEPANYAAGQSLIAMLLEEKNEEEAIAVANRAGEQNATLGAILKANVYRRTDRAEEAINVLQAQLTETPSTYLVQQTYALLTEVGRRNEAETLLTSWLGDNPDDATILQMLGAHYIEEKKLNAAAPPLERAFTLLPNDVVILNNLAWLRYELNKPGAVQLARRAYRMAPNAPAIVDTLGWILVRDGDVEEGLKLLYAAADAAPENGDIAYHVAYALNETGKQQEAADLLDRVLAEEIDARNFVEREKAEALRTRLRQG
jgi:cellulose synthase operon protein C